MTRDEWWDGQVALHDALIAAGNDPMLTIEQDREIVRQINGLYRNCPIQHDPQLDALTELVQDFPLMSYVYRMTHAYPSSYVDRARAQRKSGFIPLKYLSKFLWRHPAFSRLGYDVRKHDLARCINAAIEAEILEPVSPEDAARAEFTPGQLVYRIGRNA